MSSRYYNNYYFSPPQYSQPYRPRVTNKPSPYYYSKPQYTIKSPKSKGASNVYEIRDIGADQYSPALARKKAMGHWKAKKKQDKELDKKTILGEFNQEAIEAELNKYKKGVFYHNDKQKKENKINGHFKSDNKETQYSQFQLTRTEKAPPPIYEDLPRAVPPNYDERMQSTDTNSDNIDENKKQSDLSHKKASTSSSKPRSKQVIEDTKQREDNIKPPPAINKTPSAKKRSHRSTRGTRGGRAGRAPYAVYGPPPPPNTGNMPYDPYYQHAPGYYGQPPLANYNYYENNYGREEMYAAMPPPADYPSYNTYNTYNQYGTPYDYNRGVVQNDGSWYPYPDVLAPRHPAPPPPTAGKDPYSTPKPKKRKGRDKDKAMVDLTTPIVDRDRDRDRDKDKPMSPGRRVNKIQKQLEYYFSANNMNGDDFMRESMDGKGYVSIDILLAFKRMKLLDATKELVIEAAYHSTSIEIDPKHENKLRMTKYWKQYVKRKHKKEKEKVKRERDRDREREKELDNAELNTQTIESIVAGIEKKHEKRKKRRQQREREKEKVRKAEDKKDKKVKEKEEENENKIETEENKQDKQEENVTNINAQQVNEENAQELIKKDKEENDNDCGDPQHTDMLVID